MKLINNIVRVTVSNLLQLGSNFLVGFILPTYLSVAQYGYYREYVLFLSFVYIFNLGYNDGIYIKYGGREFSQLDRATLRSEHNFISSFHLLELVLMLAFSALTQNIIWLLFSFSTFFSSLSTYHNNFLQATGNFVKFSRYSLIATFINIITIVAALLSPGKDNHITYVTMLVLTSALVCLLLELDYLRELGLPGKISLKENLPIFRVGIMMLIGNMCFAFVSNIGLWVSNRTLPIEEFSQYSFANSLLNIILIVVNSISLVFYNLIAREKNKGQLQLLQKLLLLVGALSGMVYFIFGLVINHFLPNYQDSLQVLAFVFVSVPYIMSTKIVVMNLYKTRNNEKRYLLHMVLFALLSLGIVYGAYLVDQSILAIALATTVVHALWFYYTSYFEFSFLQADRLDITLLLSSGFLLIVFARHVSLLWGCLLYGLYCLLLLFAYRKLLGPIWKKIRT